MAIFMIQQRRKHIDLSFMVAEIFSESVDSVTMENKKKNGKKKYWELDRLVGISKKRIMENYGKENSKDI